MAKRAVKTVRMKTVNDLLTWVYAALGTNWSVSVTEELTHRMDRDSRSQSTSFRLFVMHQITHRHEGAVGSSIVALADQFQKVVYPKLRTPEPPKAQLVIEHQQRKLTHTPSLPFSS